MSDLKQMGRLALRVEGAYWRAYFALPDTMEGAIEVGGIAMAAITNNPTRKQAFMDMMREFVGEILAERLGQTPQWNDPVNAPEHERAGRA